MGRVENKVAIVTGGARGLGLATAQMLIKEGAKVAVTDILDKEGEAAVKAIVAAGGTAKYWHLDTTSETEVKRVYDEVYKEFGKLNISINNAGVVDSNSVEDTTLEDWNHVQAVNSTGVFLCTRAAIELMKKCGGGSIVNISSIAGLVGFATMPAYNASKGACKLFTKSAALHCAENKLNIRVNSIHPGYIWTPMVQGIGEGTGDAPGFKAFLDTAHPIGHTGDLDDIAYGCLYLASDESKWVTGSELVIDGGYTCQ